MQQTGDLEDVLMAIPDAIADVRYATTNNFTGQQLYIEPVVWLRSEPLAALVKGTEELHNDGYKLVLFDGYRPQSVQAILRTFCDDGDYVLEISNHCKGITVDVGLADQVGNYLDMGTDYDDFTPRSHPGSELISDEQATNRNKLASVLRGYGWRQHPHEWWHFDYHPERDWPLLNDELNALRR
jgi:D-alanyl-D-alanine dipeptidase